jgi:hypothetical protein
VWAGHFPAAVSTESTSLLLAHALKEVASLDAAATATPLTTTTIAPDAIPHLIHCDRLTLVSSRLGPKHHTVTTSRSHAYSNAMPPTPGWRVQPLADLDDKGV